MSGRGTARGADGLSLRVGGWARFMSIQPKPTHSPRNCLYLDPSRYIIKTRVEKRRGNCVRNATLKPVPADVVGCRINGPEIM